MYATNQDTLFGSEDVCIGGVHCFSLSIGNFYMFTAFMADFIVTSIQYTDDI